jgi:hypothetical protein
MAQHQENPVKLTPPIATEAVFGVHATAIDYHLSELVMDIHLARDSTGDDAIYHSLSLLGTCHSLMGYLMAHSDNLITQKKYEPK